MAVRAEKHALRCLGATFLDAARQTTLADLKRLSRWVKVMKLQGRWMLVEAAQDTSAPSLID